MRYPTNWYKDSELALAIVLGIVGLALIAVGAGIAELVRWVL